jgi:methylmalonyl-CoA/ethylmalonyl-CoA epimerase
MNHAADPSPHPAHLTQIGQIAITVRDLAGSREFYENSLGLQFLFQTGNMLFFQCGSIRLLIGTSKAASTTSSAGTILYFRVADVHETHAALEKNGVKFLQPPHIAARMPEHDLWMAFFKDPDGNAFGLMSEVAREGEPESQ